MSQSTSLTASSSVPIPILPPPPLPPYSPDTLVSCISTTTFLDAPDFSSGPASSSTAVDASKVKVWNYHSIRFTLNEAMLDDEMEPRLRFLDLNGPDPRLGPPFAPPPITSEANVRSALVEVIRTVNHIAKEHRYHPHPKTDDSYPLWQEQISQQARPDQRLYSVKIDPTSRPNQEARPRMMEAKKMAHLRSIVKLMANKAIGKGFKLIAGSDGSINLDNQDGVWTDVGADDRERVRKLVTQPHGPLLIRSHILEKVVNECFVNNTSSNLVTDSSRYLLFRRAKDDPSYPAPPSDIHTHRHQAHFKLSPPVGNRGLLNLATPESDLEPVDARPRLLCHKPLGLGLALSFDLPEDVDGSGVDSPVKQGEKDQGRRKRASGSRWPNRSLGVETRSRAATEGVTRAEAGAGVDRSGEGGGGGTGQDMDNGRRKGSSNAANHYSALKPPDSGISISSDVLLSPIPTLAPHLVGPYSMTVMFPPKGSLAHNQSEFGIGTGTTETVSHLFDGLLSGPYEPDATTAETRAMVPQLLSNSDGDDAWYYRPDSPIPLPNSEPFDLTLISSGTTTTTSYNEISKSVLPPSIKSIDTTRTLAPFPASSPTIDTSLTSSALISTGCDRLGLRLLSPLSHGRLWTVYRALLIPAHPLSSPESDRTEGSPLPVMVKLCLPLLFPCRPCADSYSEFTARSAILNEHSVFAHMPKRLLGKLVPTYYGLWGGVFTMEDRWSSSASESGRMMTGAIARREVWLMVLEDCGEGVGDGGQGLTGDERSTILSLYTSLHKAGIVHRDVETRHWLRHRDGSMRIIDFDMAVVHHLDSKDNSRSARRKRAERKSEMESEMRRVRYLLE